MSFAELLAGASPREQGVACTVPASWHQGRTAYGGFSAALALAAAMRAGGEGLPPLRSAQFAMIAPVNGAVEVSAGIVRRGRNATWAEARIDSNGGLAFTASLVFMGPIASDLHLDECRAPAGFTPPEQARPVMYSQHTPEFLREYFECRHALPPALPPGQGARPEMCRWVRLADHAGIEPMLALVLLADALPPGVMPRLPAGVPVSTMHWQCNLLSPAPQTRDGWWLLRSTGDYAELGCSSQSMAIWNADGVPVLTGMQSVAVFG